jgi:uncharacterized membrane protein required for colicin V production
MMLLIVWPKSTSCVVFLGQAIRGAAAIILALRLVRAELVGLAQRSLGLLLCAALWLVFHAAALLWNAFASVERSERGMMQTTFSLVCPLLPLGASMQPSIKPPECPNSPHC